MKTPPKFTETSGHISVREKTPDFIIDECNNKQNCDETQLFKALHCDFSITVRGILLHHTKYITVLLFSFILQIFQENR